MFQKRQLLFFSLITISTFGFGESKECKIIVLENVGYCPYAPVDAIFSEIDSKDYNKFINFIRDSTYSLVPDFGSQEEDYSFIENCKDSLDLDLFFKIVLESKTAFAFIESNLVRNSSLDAENFALAHGSMQIRMYDSEGKLMKSFHTIGLSNTKTWFNYLAKKCDEIESFKNWRLGSGLLLIIDWIEERCLAKPEYEDD